jgi:hypothetical protein
MNLTKEQREKLKQRIADNIKSSYGENVHGALFVAEKILRVIEEESVRDEEGSCWGLSEGTHA